MRFLYFITFFLIGITALGQKNLRPGFIITNDADTIHGFIDYRGETRSMKRCLFQKDEEVGSVEYTPGEIQGYRFTDDGKYYVTKYLNTNSFNDTVFVEYLVKGITDLYYYQKPLTGYYFLENSDGELLELTNEQVKVEKNGHDYWVDNKRYIGLLSYAFGDCPEVLSKVQTTKLNHRSLINITKKYHEYECDNESCIIYEKQSSGIRMKFMPSVGYSVSNISMLEKVWSSTDFDQVYHPELGIGMDFLFPKLNDKLSVFINVIIRKQDFHGINSDDAPFYYHHFNLKSTNATLGFSLKYTYPKGKIRPVFFAGPMGVIEINNQASNALYSSNAGTDGSQKIEEKDIPEFFNGFQPGVWGGVGFESPVGGLKLFMNLCFYSGWNAKEGFYRFQRTTASLSVGCAF